MDPESPLRRLRRYNVGMGLLHAIQGIAVLALSNDFSLPVTAAFMEGPPGSAATTKDLFALPLGPGRRGVPLHVGGGAPADRRPDLGLVPGSACAGSRSYARWIEYAFSSSLMVVLIAMITGIADIAASCLGGVNASMICSAWSRSTTRARTGGHAPIHLRVHCGRHSLDRDRDLHVDAGVDGQATGLRLRDIHVALPLLQLLCGQHGLQYRRIGPWRTYLFGE